MQGTYRILKSVIRTPSPHLLLSLLRQRPFNHLETLLSSFISRVSAIRKPFSRPCLFQPIHSLFQILKYKQPLVDVGSPLYSLCYSAKSVGGPGDPEGLGRCHLQFSNSPMVQQSAGAI